MPGAHDRIIADAAKSALGILDFRRKGRSRVWFADHGWWLTVVEFQPSAWSKGSYLNVAAHWLWSDAGVIAFNFGGRIHGHIEYQSDAQFTPAACGLAAQAAHEAQRLAQMFTSLEATANVVLAVERAKSQGAGGWTAYHAGVFAALIGHKDAALDMFGRVLNGFAEPDSALYMSAERMKHLAVDVDQFKGEVTLLIERQRDALKLKQLEQFEL